MAFFVKEIFFSIYIVKVIWFAV